jgi:hypothetical protein
MQAVRQTHPDPSAVLSKATARAAELLKLNNAALARVIGLSEPTITRVRGGRGIDPASKEGQLALLLVRVFRSLDPLVGGDDAKRMAWMHNHNKALQGVPAKLLESPEGLVNTLAYLDGMRAPA